MRGYRTCLGWLAGVILVTVLTAAPVCALSEDAPPPVPAEGDVWDGSTERPEILVQRDGVYYYEITKCSQLAYVATSSQREWCTYNYILGNNLILNEAVITWDSEGNCTNADQLLKWTPIGGSAYGDGGIKFSGTFLGNGYVISGMYVPNGSCQFNGLFSQLTGNVDGVHIVNSYVGWGNSAGGLAGQTGVSYCIEISNCSFSGMVNGVGSSYGTGGIVGYTNRNTPVYFDSVSNYGYVLGRSRVGGIVGNAEGATISNSKNSGNVCGAGLSSVDNKEIGGIVGSYGTVYTSYNRGNVKGRDYVGGISGGYTNIYSCYNLGDIEGTEFVGGITGSNAAEYSYEDGYKISGCYNAGVIQYTTYGGAIAGKSDHVWGKAEVKDCYYLWDASHNTNPFGNFSGDTAGAANAADSAHMRQMDTFAGWDFSETWTLDLSQNEGYPCFIWQLSGEIHVTGITLDKTSITMFVGEREQLTATVLPSYATNTAYIWASSNEAVVTVSESGEVTAVGPGYAYVKANTVDGGFSAHCDITVTIQPQPSDEYRVNYIVPRDENGEILDRLPSGNFWASVSITKLSSVGDGMVLLASYGADGKYLNMLCARISGLPAGATVELSFLMDNSDRKIGELKAFPVSSFAGLTPLGGAAAWKP